MHTKVIAFVCIFFFLGTEVLMAQNESLSVQRSSRLKPISELEILQKQQRKNQRRVENLRIPIAAGSKAHTTKFSHSAGNTSDDVVADPTPHLQNATFPETDPAHGTLSLFVLIALGVAVANAAGAVWYFKYRKSLRKIPKPAITVIPEKPIRKEESIPEMEKKNNHVAEYSLQEEQEMETENSEKRLSSEVELVEALRELKSKYQAKELEKVAKKKPTKKHTPKEAKKLGTGIGEVELARRLEQMRKKHSKGNDSD